MFTYRVLHVYSFGRRSLAHTVRLSSAPVDYHPARSNVAGSQDTPGPLVERGDEKEETREERNENGAERFSQEAAPLHVLYHGSVGKRTRSKTRGGARGWG